MENKRIHGYTDEMKKATAKKWAEKFLQSEDGIKWKEESDKQFKEYVILGKRTEYFDEGLIDEILNYANSSNRKI